MAQIRERDEDNAKRKQRLAKLKRGPGVFKYDGSLARVEHIPTPKLMGNNVPVLDAQGFPVMDDSGRQMYQRPNVPVRDDQGRIVLGGVPKVKRIPLDEFVIRGVKFPAGEAVPVKDASLALKLRGMDGFEEVEEEEPEASGEAKPRRGRPSKKKPEVETEEGEE